MRQMVAAICLTLGIVAKAFAQAPASEHGRAAGSFGGGQTWDDEGSIGNGPGAGGRVEWRLVGRTSVEGSFDVLRHDRSGGAFGAQGTSRILGVSLIQRFGSLGVPVALTAAAFVIGLFVLPAAKETKGEPLPA